VEFGKNRVLSVYTTGSGVANGSLLLGIGGRLWQNATSMVEEYVPMQNTLKRGSVATK